MAMLRRMEICRNCKEFYNDKSTGTWCLVEDSRTRIKTTGYYNISFEHRLVPDNCLFKTEHEIMDWNEESE